ncbi:hypothetical protein CHARACLAT_025886 [Characodon lateralis]|uniref:Uncharacterized protein n=1 Tax=Characodon lateralis TaxID=208331 RepID=A0ABU7F749_9TELE|nr:hypothetical protein [Characodon lateralis]
MALQRILNWSAYSVCGQEGMKGGDMRVGEGPEGHIFSGVPLLLITLLHTHKQLLNTEDANYKYSHHRIPVLDTKPAHHFLITTVPCSNMSIEVCTNHHSHLWAYSASLYLTHSIISPSPLTHIIPVGHNHQQH